MDTGNTPDLDGLIGQASRGDPRARMELLSRYRDRLRQMVAARLDRRLRLASTLPMLCRRRSRLPACGWTTTPGTDRSHFIPGSGRSPGSG